MSAAVIVPPLRGVRNLPKPLCPTASDTLPVGDRSCAWQAEPPPDAPRSGALGGGRLAGLVSSKTSSTQGASESFTVSRKDGRNRRKARTLAIAARLIVDQVQSGWHCLLVTLTYRDGEKWKPGDISGYLNRVEMWARRKGVKPLMLMSMEPSEVGRKVPHYHILIWLPRKLLLPKGDKRGWWLRGHTNTKVVQSAVGYVSKYVAKSSGGALPRRAHCCSVRGLCPAGRRMRSFLMLPGYVREMFSETDRVRRAAGGGWLSVSSGIWTPAQWRLVAHANDWSWSTFAPVDAPRGDEKCKVDTN